MALLLQVEAYRRRHRKNPLLEPLLHNFDSPDWITDGDDDVKKTKSDAGSANSEELSETWTLRRGPRTDRDPPVSRGGGDGSTTPEARARRSCVPCRSLPATPTYCSSASGRWTLHPKTVGSAGSTIVRLALHAGKALSTNSRKWERQSSVRCFISRFLMSHCADAKKLWCLTVAFGRKIVCRTPVPQRSQCHYNIDDY